MKSNEINAGTDCGFGEKKIEKWLWKLAQKLTGVILTVGARRIEMIEDAQLFMEIVSAKIGQRISAHDHQQHEQKDRDGDPFWQL